MCSVTSSIKRCFATLLICIAAGCQDKVNICFKSHPISFDEVFVKHCGEDIVLVSVSNDYWTNEKVIKQRCEIFEFFGIPSDAEVDYLGGLYAGLFFERTLFVEIGDLNETDKWKRLRYSRPSETALVTCEP